MDSHFVLVGEDFMDKLYLCAQAFASLLDYEYYIVACSKRTRIDFTIRFLPEHLPHLIGLNKLSDLQNVRQALLNKKGCIKEIFSGKLNEESLKRSVFYDDIVDRLVYFQEIEGLLDSRETMVSVDQGRTTIKADYILYDYQQNRYKYFFLKEKDGNACGCTFFTRADNAYILNTQRFTIMRKEKRNIKTNDVITLIEKPIRELLT